MKSQIYYDYYPSPIGQLLLLATEEGLIYIELGQEQQTTSLDNFLSAQAASGQILEIFAKPKKF